MKILILDDNQFRHTGFERKFIGHDLIHVYTAEECINKLIELKGNFDILYLDHDLGGQEMISSGKGTGWEVASFISENEQYKPNGYGCIFLHSLNPAGRLNMKNKLPEALEVPFAWLASTKTV